MIYKYKIGVEGHIDESSSVVNCEFGKYVDIAKLNHIENCSFDDFTYTGPFCYVQNARIGKFTNIAPSVRIGPTDHPMDKPALHHFTYRASLYGFQDDDVEFFKQRESRITTIGNDVWIGHGAIILPDVTIGDGAVIGAGAVVTRDVQPFEIVVGVPARTVRYRFDQDTILKLKAIAWWNWDTDKIIGSIDNFKLDIHEFIKMYYTE